MYKRILVPLDRSELAETALPYAEELARRLSSEIHVATVEEYNMNQAHAHKPGQPLKGKAETIERNTQEYLSTLLLNSEKVKTAVLIGHAAEGIVAYANKENIDLIITDVVMPGMSGNEVVRKIGVDDKGVEVLYISGYSDDSVVRRGIQEDGMHFLQKPFTPNELSQKVRRILDGAG